MRPEDAQEQYDRRRLDAFVQLRVLDEIYNGRTLAKLLLRKLGRRLWGERNPLEAVTSYNGLIVFDRPRLHGGGLSFGADYPRVLLELGIGRVERGFEFCAGPGYIGFLLFAEGFCNTLALADVNPAAVNAAQATIDYNSLADRVQVFESDALDAIPAEERWDLVVGNPPHFLQVEPADSDIRLVDPDWELHRRFYAAVGRFLNPGAKVVLVENSGGSSSDIFEPMIRAGGGTIERVLPGTDVFGRSNGLYYLVSRFS